MTTAGMDPEFDALTADDRDQRADNRDRSAEERDRAAEARDLEDERRHRRVHPIATRDGRSQPAERRRVGAGRRTIDLAAASDRREAAADRHAASGSRRVGAEDRIRASDDRQAALADRDAAARERNVSSIDDLTGAHRRGPGLVELEREWSRAQRTRRPFVVAFIDVDGLKVKNDSLGHAAGDALLLDVVNAIRGRLRSYDLIVRFGGDEFVCALMDLDAAETAKRFALVEADLALVNASITVGLAELGSEDSLADLIARADAELYALRSLRPSTTR